MVVGYTSISREERDDGKVARNFFGNQAPDRIVTDIVCSPTSERPNLQNLKVELEEEDTLIIPRLNRFEGTVVETLQTVEHFYGNRIRVLSLYEPFDSFSDDSVQTLRVVLSLLEINNGDAPRPVSYDRVANRTRKFGRSPALSKLDIKRIQQLASHGASIQELMASFRCSRRTIERAIIGNHSS